MENEVLTKKEYLDKVKNDEVQTEEVELTTDMVVVTSDNSLAVTPQFADILNQIPIQLSECDELLTEYRKSPDEFFDKHSEEEIDGTIKELRELNSFTRNVKKSRQAVKKFLDSRRDAALNVLDVYLEGADFSGLEMAEQDMKKMKNDLARYREDRRWMEVEEVFNAAFETVDAQEVKRVFPDLADFSKFKARHQDMVSGAKTKPVTQQTKQQVREIVASYADAVVMLSSNPWNLDMPYYNRLMGDFATNPDFSTLNSRGQRLLEQQEFDKQMEQKRKEQMEAAKRLEEERKKKEAENLKRIEELKKQNQNEQANKPIEKRSENPQPEVKKSEPAYVSPVTSYIPPMMRLKYPVVTSYIEQRKSYENLHTSSDDKARCICDMCLNLQNSESPFGQEVGIDSQKFVELARFILDM